jgi:crossover junction endodeoxyribonuclease RuvC
MRTGYGAIRLGSGRTSVVEAGFVSTADVKKGPMEGRLKVIYEAVREVIERLKPESVAVEQLYSHYAHPRTAILMGHARGVIFLAAAMCDVPVVSYSATQVKKSLTGNGRAGKMQVQRMVAGVLGLDKEPEPNDVADALAVALCHASHSARKEI